MSFGSVTLRPGLAAAAALLALACSESIRTDGGAGDDASVPLSDAGTYDVPDCGVGFSYYEFEYDGVSGNTGCVTARTGWLLRDESVAPGRPRSQLQFLYADEAASELPLRGLPTPQLCGGNIQLFNIEPVTDASGAVVGDWEIDGEASAGVLFTSYTQVDACDVRTPATAGRWRVVSGGTVGDVLEIHATGVEIEPFEGHTLRFPLMVWRAVIMEPTMFP